MSEVNTPQADARQHALSETARTPGRPLRRLLLIVTATIAAFVLAIVAFVAIIDERIPLAVRAFGGAVFTAGVVWVGYLIYRGRRAKASAAKEEAEPMTLGQRVLGVIVAAGVCAAVVGVRLGIESWGKRAAPPAAPGTMAPAAMQELLKTDAGRRVAAEMAKRAMQGQGQGAATQDGGPAGQAVRVHDDGG
jgi:hypothetical protein